MVAVVEVLHAGVDIGLLPCERIPELHHQRMGDDHRGALSLTEFPRVEARGSIEAWRVFVMPWIPWLRFHGWKPVAPLKALVAHGGAAK